MAEELLEAGGFSKRFGIQLLDMMALLTEAGCTKYPAYAPGFWPRYSVEEVEGNLKRLAASGRGLDRQAAALEMGLRPESFDVIADDIQCSAEGKYLTEFLVAYRRSRLPKNKIWFTRTSLVQGLIEVIKIEHPGQADLVEMQLCEIPDCTDAAIDQCSGNKCRDTHEGRGMYLCPRHARPEPGARISPDYPDVFCPICRQDD